jgi:hypothetical protein
MVLRRNLVQVSSRGVTCNSIGCVTSRCVDLRGRDRVRSLYHDGSSCLRNRDACSHHKDKGDPWCSRTKCSHLALPSPSDATSAGTNSYRFSRYISERHPVWRRASPQPAGRLSKRDRRAWISSRCIQQCGHKCSVAGLNARNSSGTDQTLHEKPVHLDCR